MCRAADALVALALAMPQVLAAQGPGAPSAFDLEREGRVEEAAAAYAATLDSAPGRVADLLGLERVLRRLSQLDELVPYVDRAVATVPTQEVVRDVELRVYATLFGADSARAVAARWADELPSSRNPYRALARWLVDGGDLDGAERALADGETRTGESMAEIRAQVAATAGAWPRAAGAWREAARANPGFVSAGAASLGLAPPDARDAVLEVLVAGDTPPEAELAAEVLVRWGRAEDAWVALDRGLVTDRPTAVGMLRRFAARVQRVSTSAGARARGLALERLAALVEPREAATLRLDAARAYAEAGYPDAARRLLDRATASRAGSAQDAQAAATLVDVTITAGRLDEAERRLAEVRDRLGPDEAARLRTALARAWLHAGDVDRAERTLDDDSSVVSLGVRGRIAAYRGSLDTARTLLTAAGASASPEDAAARAALLVLVERVDVPRAPALGAALLTLATGDSLRAAERLAVAARDLPSRRGRADVLIMAADVAAALARPDDAEAWYRIALADEPNGPGAPHAEFALAVLMHDRGASAEARDQLEHLIIAHPGSAVVPRARRLLDTVRGVLPP